MNQRNIRTRLADATARETLPEAPNALTVRLGEIVFPAGVETLGEQANFLHAYSVEASKRSTVAAILAGWVLSVARSTSAHGQWLTWLAQNVCFSKRTAANYMSLYAQTLGKARANARRPIALDVHPTAEELEEAAHDVDGASLSALYRSTRLVAASGWGGNREGAGRKPEGEGQGASVAEQLDAVANSPALLVAAIREPIAAVYRAWRERDVFARIDMDELSIVAASLVELANAAQEAIEARSE